MLIFSLDCRSEFTAESLVGALADLGVSPSTFEWELSQIEVGDHHLHFDREEVQGVQAVRFGVHGGILHVDHPHSPQDHDHTDRENDIPYVQVRRRIEAARCSAFVRSHSLGIFHRIASAKGELSEIPVEQIQFREAEALEWLVTAVLSCIGLDQMGLAQIFFRQTNRGEPIGHPPPDHALSRAILSQLSASGPISASPVGAAILAEFAAKFDSPPKLKSTRIGHGLGPNTDRGQPSLLQATLGEAE
ncbi:MAG TPA: nickel insertion protein [Chthoniobacterales bacterium]|nr:nickel insertion protein [Chthoniobacterales bacterium]